ncbi:MAG: phosphatase PAP2 family protein [Phycisphaerales bacterium]
MSRWLLPFERRVVWARRRRAIALALVGYLVVRVFDGVIYRALDVGYNKLEPDVARQRIASKDWYEFLRAAGYWPTWGVLALAIGLARMTPAGADAGMERAHAASRLTAVRLALAPAVAGLLAEAMKVLIGRQRPINNGVAEGAHVFKGLLERFTDPRNLGLPSSHVACAFGAAAAVWMLWGRAGWPVVLVAAGCGVTRMLTGAHFATDVYAGALVGIVGAMIVCPRKQPGLLLP